MSDVARLLDLFRQGALVRPGRGECTTVDLIRALYRLCGASGLSASEHCRSLEEAIGPADHYLFVLIDGLGTDMLERFSPDGFCSRHLHGTVQPVFPSTTASAFTSFATAEYPATHGITSWWMYFPDPGVSATILPFVERFSGASLTDHGLTPEVAFPVPSRLPGLAHDAAMITPRAYADSVYSNFCTGFGPRLPYDEKTDAFELALDRIRRANRPTFTWLYLPDVDGKAHAHGVHSDEVAEELAETEALLGELTRELAGTARIVATADHGLTDVPVSRQHFLPADDPLLEMLEAPITGEPTIPMFHVREGQADRFASAFRARLGEDFVLLTTGEVAELELLGPGPLSVATRTRLGQFLAIPGSPTILREASDQEVPPDFRAYHAGLSREEMRVPVILA